MAPGAMSEAARARSVVVKFVTPAPDCSRLVLKTSGKAFAAAGARANVRTATAAQSPARKDLGPTHDLPQIDAQAPRT